MPINYSVTFNVSECKNSNAIIKVNCAICNYLGYSYVNTNSMGFIPVKLFRRVMQYFRHFSPVL